MVSLSSQYDVKALYGGCVLKVKNHAVDAFSVKPFGGSFDCVPAIKEL